MSTVHLFVGTRKGAFVLESSNNRSDWTVQGPFLKGWKVANIAYDDRGTPRLFAAVGHFVYGPTIHRSDDFGTTWEQVEQSPTYPPENGAELNQIWSITPGPETAPSILYAGVDEAGLFVSRDGGDHWAELPGLRAHPTRDRWFPGKGGLCCHSVLVSPRDPDRLWVGISAVGVFRSDDGGETWQLKNEGLPVVDAEGTGDSLGSCVHRLVLDPEDPDRLYQQNHLGVFRSTDAGDHWERIDDGLPSTFGFPMAIHPHDPTTLYTFPLESDEYRMAIDGAPAVYRT